MDVYEKATGIARWLPGFVALRELLINKDPAQYAHYFVAEARGLLEPHELQTWRLLYGPPAPYTHERFQDTYRWMQGYPDLVAPGATYEEVVDNRAWQ